MDALPVAAARAAALQALADVRSGRRPDPVDLDAFERTVQATGDVEHALDVGFPDVVEEQSDEDRRRRGPWQWRDLVEEFLASKAKGQKPGYERKYAAYHRGPEFEEMERRYVGELHIRHLEALRIASSSNEQYRQRRGWSVRTGRC